MTTPRALLEMTQALLGVEAAARPPLLLPDLLMSPDLVESPTLQTDMYLPTLLHSALSLGFKMFLTEKDVILVEGALGGRRGGGPLSPVTPLWLPYGKQNHLVAQLPHGSFCEQSNLNLQRY